METDNVRVIETKELHVSGGKVPEFRVVKQLDQTGNEVEVVLEERERAFFFFFFFFLEDEEKRRLDQEKKRLEENVPLVQVVSLRLLELLIRNETLNTFGTSSDLEPLVLPQVDVCLKDMLHDDEPCFVLFCFCFCASSFR